MSLSKMTEICLKRISNLIAETLSQKSMVKCWQKMVIFEEKRGYIRYRPKNRKISINVNLTKLYTLVYNIIMFL